MRRIGTRGEYGHPVLPDSMMFFNWEELPWFWYGFDQFWFAAVMVALVPGALARGKNIRQNRRPDQPSPPHALRRGGRARGAEGGALPERGPRRGGG